MRFGHVVWTFGSDVRFEGRSVATVKGATATSTDRANLVHGPFTKFATESAVNLFQLHTVPAYALSCDLHVKQQKNPMPANVAALSLQRILLAEDDESMRGFLERALEKAGYTVIACGNGADAFDRLKQEPFSLLLTDIVMPRMDGIELARRAAEIDPELKIMFITGFAAVTLNNETRTPKDARVLSKPFHLKDLVNEVGKLLAA